MLNTVCDTPGTGTSLPSPLLAEFAASRLGHNEGQLCREIVRWRPAGVMNRGGYLQSWAWGIDNTVIIEFHPKIPPRVIDAEDITQNPPAAAS